MSSKRVLFISGSLGLGHVGRDLEIAKAVRKDHPDIEISWLADNPATVVLKEAGERLLPEADLVTHGNQRLDSSVGDYNSNLVRWMMDMRKDWARNVEIFASVTRREHFDLVVGDETYDLQIGFAANPHLKRFPFVMIYDFIGLDAITPNLTEKLAAYVTNRRWMKNLTGERPIADRFIFVGEAEDVPDRRFGFMLPNRRKIAEKYVRFVGYVLTFDPKDYSDRTEVRQELGYGNEPLIVCFIGGTARGKPLLDLCAQSFGIIEREIPDCRMVLVCGPRVSPDSVKATEGVEVKEYVPELYKHLAAADLSIVTGEER